MTEHDETQPEPIITDEDVALLNEARTILDTFGKRCAARSWNAPDGYRQEANAADYGRVHALSEVASSAIFTVLNWTNSHHVHPLTDAQLHNYAAEPVEVAAA